VQDSKVFNNSLFRMHNARNFNKLVERKESV
jgi:hypothetical protein